MSKTERKRIIAWLSVVAALVKDQMDQPGIVGFNVNVNGKAYVQLQPWLFFELFGDDTEYEYSEKDPTFRSIRTESNGVEFIAIMSGFDLIKDGRLAA